MICPMCGSEEVSDIAPWGKHQHWCRCRYCGNDYFIDNDILELEEVEA